MRARRPLREDGAQAGGGAGGGRFDRARDQANRERFERIHNPTNMRTWQDPDVPLEERLQRFAAVAELDDLCVHRLHRLPEAALLEVLNKQRWGRYSDNMNAVVTA
eukprot:15456195-Alexandrium_andersonii.AAC.1